MGKNKYRIGIGGGMGPMAGVMLQKLIIENTVATKDQDHIQVVCFTNPDIPDRTISLKENNGEAFSSAIVQSIKVLEKTGVQSILLPCNTSHTRFNEIQNESAVPLVNMVQIMLDKMRKENVTTFGLLATDGTIAAKVFETDKNLKVILPDVATQKNVMDTIYKIKSGLYNDPVIRASLNSIVEHLEQQGAERIVLGCTELSLYTSLLTNKNIVDPLVELAKEAVNLGGR